MTGNIVARRYAGALFAVGKKQGGDALAAFGKDLAVLAESFAAAPALERVFANPIVGIEEKKAVISGVLDKIGAAPLVKNFCLLLADKNRLSALPAIGEVFTSLVDAEQGVMRGKVVTAVAVNDAKQQAIADKLEAQASQKLVLDFETDEGILGGLILQIGDRVMDASLRAQLDILKDNIKRGE